MSSLVSVVLDPEASIRIEGGLSADTPLHLCSVAKTLTAVAVLRLTGRGVLDLDGDVREWVPVPGGGGPTLRQLLRHRGGMSDPAGAFEPVSGPAVVDPAWLTIGSAPGTSAEYSDAGYCLVELAVQEATGESFAAVMDAEIAAPLGLRSTAFWAGEPHRFAATAAVGRGGVGPRQHYPGLAASGLWSSAADVVIWLADLGQALAGTDGVLLTAEQAAQWVADPEESGFGAGVFPFGAPGRPCVMSQGWGVGFQCQLRWYPAAGGAALVLIDRDPGVPQGESQVGRTLLRLVDQRGWR